MYECIYINSPTHQTSHNRGNERYRRNNKSIDGSKQWQTKFKESQMKGLLARRRIWFESVIENSNDEDYKLISAIILRDKLYRADPT